MSFKVKFAYINESGCKWLEESKLVEDRQDAFTGLEQYVDDCKESAKQFTQKWLREGVDDKETALLWAIAECDDKQLEIDLNNYLEENS